MPQAGIKHIVRHIPCDMGKSLTLKLRGMHVLTEDQIKQITRYLPRDVDRLHQLIAGLSEEDVAKVLKVTTTHERDQEQFLECVSTLRAYARGGLAGMDLLNKLHGVIIGHYGMHDEKWEVLTAAGVAVDFETGRLSVHD